MQTIYLDISNKGVIPCIQAKQSEVGRKFLAVITDNGVPYNIPDNSLLSVWYEGDTDAGNYSSIEENSAFSIDGNKVTVELVAQMLLKHGKGELCLSISHGDGGETNTWNIPYEVEYKPGAGSAVPTEYYTALTDAAARAAEQVGYSAASAEEAARQAAVAKEYADALVEANETILALKEILMPIGYIFHWEAVEGSGINLTTPENVSEYFGFGSWQQIKDVFLLSAGDEHLAGTVGGAETHTLSVSEMPSHNHEKIFTAITEQNLTGSTGQPGVIANAAHVQFNTGVSGDQNFTTSNTGGGSAFSIMPPYRTVYTWLRIA